LLLRLDNDQDDLLYFLAWLQCRKSCICDLSDLFMSQLFLTPLGMIQPHC